MSFRRKMVIVILVKCFFHMNRINFHGRIFLVVLQKLYMIIYYFKNQSNYIYSIFLH